MGSRRRNPKFWLITRDTVWLVVCALIVGAVSSWPMPIRQAASVWTALSAVADGDVMTGNELVKTVATSSASLVEQLRQVAKKVDAPPVNAQVSSAWRLIPGVNGVRLNVEKTLQNPGATPLVFDQIPPATGIDAFVAEPIFKGNAAKRQIALMINVAWGTEYVPAILKILREHHVLATFFLDGTWTKKNPGVAKSIVQAGMELGNHAYNHPAMSRLSRTAMITQITRTNEVITSATGTTPTLFAPPSGDFNQLVVRVAAGLHMRTILWTLDTIDWRKPSPQTIVNRIVPKRVPGALVLMHPTAPTVAALPQLIASLQRDGYQLVTVSTLISPVRPVPVSIKDALFSP